MADPKQNFPFPFSPKIERLGHVEVFRLAGREMVGVQCALHPEKKMSVELPWSPDGFEDAFLMAIKNALKDCPGCIWLTRAKQTIWPEGAEL